MHSASSILARRWLRATPSNVKQDQTAVSSREQIETECTPKPKQKDPELDEMMEYFAFAYKGGFEGTVSFELRYQDDSTIVKTIEVGQGGVRLSEGPPDKPADVVARMPRDVFMDVYTLKLSPNRAVLSGNVQVSSWAHAKKLYAFGCSFAYESSVWEEFYKRQEAHRSASMSSADAAIRAPSAAPSLSQSSPPLASAVSTASRGSPDRTTAGSSVSSTGGTSKASLFSTRNLQRAFRQRRVDRPMVRAYVPVSMGPLRWPYAASASDAQGSSVPDKDSLQSTVAKLMADSSAAAPVIPVHQLALLAQRKAVLTRDVAMIPQVRRLALETRASVFGSLSSIVNNALPPPSLPDAPPKRTLVQKVSHSQLDGHNGGSSYGGGGGAYAAMDSIDMGPGLGPDSATRALEAFRKRLRAARPRSSHSDDSLVLPPSRCEPW